MSRDRKNMFNFALTREQIEYKGHNTIHNMMPHWLLGGHMTSNNESVSHQNIWAGNIAKSMMSECWPTTVVAMGFNEFLASKFSAIKQMTDPFPEVDPRKQN